MGGGYLVTIVLLGVIAVLLALATAELRIIAREARITRHDIYEMLGVLRRSVNDHNTRLGSLETIVRNCNPCRRRTDPKPKPKGGDNADET